MKYVYATIYSVASLFIMTLVVTGNPFETTPSVLGVLIILGVSSLVFVGTVEVITRYGPNTTVTNFQVSRVLRVEGLSGGEVHHYFELKGGGILFLGANQQLDVYALPQGYSEKDGPLFPSTDFSLLRNVTTNAIVGLAIHGVSIQSEQLIVPNEKSYSSNLSLEDGDVLQGISYDELKQRILSA